MGVLLDKFGGIAFHVAISLGVAWVLKYGISVQRPAQSVWDMARKWAGWGVFFASLPSFLGVLRGSGLSVHSREDAVITWVIVCTSTGIVAAAAGAIWGAIKLKAAPAAFSAGTKAIASSKQVLSNVSTNRADVPTSTNRNNGSTGKTQPITPSTTASRTTGDEEWYEIAGQEIISGKVRPGPWARALADSHGDEAKARAQYVRIRVE